MVNRDQPAASLAPAPPVVGVLQGAAAAAARLGQVQWTQGLVYVRIDRRRLYRPRPGLHPATIDPPLHHHTLYTGLTLQCAWIPGLTRAFFLLKNTGENVEPFGNLQN